MPNLVSVEPAARAIPDSERVKYSIVMLFPCHVLTDHLPYGDGLIAYGFIAELARRGHRVYVLAHHVNVHAAFPANVEVHSLSADPEANIVDRLKFIIRSRALLRGLVRLRHVDLVHQLNPVCTGMIAGMLGIRIPLVLGTFVAYWPRDVWPPVEPNAQKSWKYPIVLALTRIVQNLAKRLQERLGVAFLVTSKAALGRFTSERNVAGRVFPMRHGVDASYFRPIPNIANPKRTILFFAGLAERKGIFTLLEAFELIYDRLPDARLIIAGTGPALEEVQRRVARMRGSSSIEFIGRIDREDVPQLMVRGNVYCLPSYGEPYATTVIEAMACGKPVVVTTGGGLGDIIDDRGGRRVEPRNAVQLAEALIEILSSPLLAESMGTHNRSIVEESYDWPRVVDNLEDVYCAVVQKS